MIKTIYIPGVPDSKMRPRATKNGHMYDPNAAKKEASIQKAQVTGYKGVFKGALRVNFDFVFPRPKSHYRTGKNAGTLRPDAPEYCCNSKDFDNLEKFYCDSFNFIHYVDDRQIVAASTFKTWAEFEKTPHVKMTIKALEPEKEEAE